MINHRKDQKREYKQKNRLFKDLCVKQVAFPKFFHDFFFPPGFDFIDGLNLLAPRFG